MEFTLKLIKEVKKFTMLYNFYSEGYRNNPKKGRVWNSIAQRLNENVETCRTKWKGLRERYILLQRQIAEDPNYKITWPYYEHLSFLSNFPLDQRIQNSESLVKDTQFGLRLIEQVKKFPLLYDTNHEDFRKLTKRIEIWEIIARTLNETSARCKLRWRTLRARYLLHMNNRKVNDVFGRTYEKPNWPFYDALEFLENYLETDYIPNNEEHDAFLKQLVEEVQNYPILYDYARKDSIVQNRNKAWRHIARQLNQKPLFCKVQFKELLALYRSVTNPDDLEENSEQWKAYHMLSFMQNIPEGNERIEAAQADGSNTFIEYIIERNENNNIEEMIVEDFNDAEFQCKENAVELDKSDFVSTAPEKSTIEGNFNKFLEETSVQLNGLTAQQKHEQRDSIGLLLRALARCVQESQLPNHKLVQLHADVTAYVYKMLHSYANRN